MRAPFCSSPSVGTQVGAVSHPLPHPRFLGHALPLPDVKGCRHSPARSNLTFAGVWTQDGETGTSSRVFRLRGYFCLHAVESVGVIYTRLQEQVWERWITQDAGRGTRDSEDESPHCHSGTPKGSLAIDQSHEFYLQTNLEIVYADLIRRVRGSCILFWKIFNSLEIKVEFHRTPRRPQPSLMCHTASSWQNSQFSSRRTE